MVVMSVRIWHHYYFTKSNHQHIRYLKAFSIVPGKFRREFHRSYFKCFCCCHTPPPEQNGTSFAPIGSRGTTRTVVRRNDSCASYRLTHLSPSNHNIHRDYVRNTNTSFIEQINGNRRPKIRDDSISESATRFTLTTDVCRDWQSGKNCPCHRKNGLGYIVKSTNSIDCKPYYDCCKVDDCISDERYSDTATDYRGEEDRNGFKVKFNRSLNSQVRDKNVDMVYWYDTNL